MNYLNGSPTDCCWFIGVSESFFMKVRIRKLPNSIDRWKDDFKMGQVFVLCAFVPPRYYAGLDSILVHEFEFLLSVLRPEMSMIGKLKDGFDTIGVFTDSFYFLRTFILLFSFSDQVHYARFFCSARLDWRDSWVLNNAP